MDTHLARFSVFDGLARRVQVHLALDHLALVIEEALCAFHSFSSKRRRKWFTQPISPAVA